MSLCLGVRFLLLIDESNEIWQQLRTKYPSIADEQLMNLAAKMQSPFKFQSPLENGLECR